MRLTSNEHNAFHKKQETRELVNCTKAGEKKQGEGPTSDSGHERKISEVTFTRDNVKIHSKRTARKETKQEQKLLSTAATETRFTEFTAKVSGDSNNSSH